MPPILIPAADMDLGFIKLTKGATYLFPACVTYAVFREDTYKALGIFIELAIQIGLCLLGIVPLTAAIRAGSALGIFAAAADITLGTLAATVNTIPEISRNHPTFVKYVNYAALIYGVSRLGYSVYKEIKIPKLSRIEQMGLDEEKLRKIEGLFDELGGRFYNEKELKVLKIKLKTEYGVDLRFADKEIAFERLPVIKNGKRFTVRSRDLYEDWKARRVFGKFDEGPPPMIILRSDMASELTVFHEKVHMEGWYNKLPKMNIVDEEKYVFEAIFNTKDIHNWTDAELIDSFDYVNNKIVIPTNKNTRSAFPLLKNEYIEQLRINKTLNF